MRIINARKQKNQEIPFVLGEAGRGRGEATVGVHGANPPQNPEDVGYVRFGKQVVLTAPRAGQTGTLVRISTKGAYTRGSDGRIRLKAGQAERLASGNFAAGEAGGLMSEPDELWHVTGAAVFLVHVAGGRYKGEEFGWFYLIVFPDGRIVWERRERLCQMIVCDDNPAVSRLLRKFSEQAKENLRRAEESKDEDEAKAEKIAAAKKALFHSDFDKAFAAAEELEDLEDEASAAVHFAQPDWLNRSLAEQIREFGIEVPASMQDDIPGVGGVKAGTLVPGPNSLVLFEYGGGGRRYGCRLVAEVGLERLAKDAGCKKDPMRVLAVTTKSDWHVAWVNTHDDEDVEWVVINAGGSHRFTSQWGMETTPWPGVEPVPMAEASLKRLFGLLADSLEEEETSVIENEPVIEAQPEPEPPESDPVDISKVDLSQLFGGAAKARK